MPMFVGRKSDEITGLNLIDFETEKSEAPFCSLMNRSRLGIMNIELMEDIMKQRTFMMLKPDGAVSPLAENIQEEIRKSGCVIEKADKIKVDMEVMQTLLMHYKEVIDRMSPEFNYVGKLFNSFYYHGEHFLIPMVVSYDQSEDIIEVTRKLVGKTEPIQADPQSIRGKYSKDSYELAAKENRLVNNLIHASDSKESAERELQLWQKWIEKQ